MLLCTFILSQRNKEAQLCRGTARRAISVVMGVADQGVQAAAVHSTFTLGSLVGGMVRQRGPITGKIMSVICTNMQFLT